MRPATYLTLFLTLLSANLYAQSKKEIQEKILFYLSETRRLKYSLDDYDSLGWANSQLMLYLKEIGRHPAVLSYSLEDTILPGMNIVTSEDKKFRVYSWDTQTGGTMRFFNELVQYRTPSGSETYVLNDINTKDAEGESNNGASFIKLYQVSTRDQSTIYLGSYISFGSSRDIVKGIQAFKIEDNLLNDSIKGFQETNSQLNEISFYFDLPISRNRRGELKNDFNFSKNKQKLYVPIVNGDDAITKKSRIYKFDGYKFVYDKTAR